MKDISFDALFSSDLPRAQTTANILKLGRTLVVQTSKLLREQSYGHFEGTPASAYHESLKKQLEERKHLSEEAWWAYRVAPDIETPEEVITRFMAELRAIASAYQGKTVLVVSHGGCIRMFLAKAGYAPIEELPPGSFSNSGQVIALSDGTNFFLKEVKGIDKNIK